MADKPTVQLRGAGGLEQTFDLPLTEQFKDQLDKAHLQPVDAEDEATLADFYADEPDAPAPVKKAAKKATAAKPKVDPAPDDEV